MKKLTILSLAFAVSLIAAGTFLTVSTSGEKQVKLIRSVQPVPNEYIVVLNEDFVGRSASAPEVDAEAQFLSAVYGGEVRKTFANAFKGFSVTMSPAQAEELSRNERVRFVEEDSVVWASATQTNAPWNLDRVDQRSLPMNSTFSYTQTGAGAHVYIIDSGIRTTHQEFGGRASVVFDAVGDGQNGNDCYGHGTHVAGTAVGATYGVAKNALVYSARVLNCSGGGTISGIAAAVDWITANRVNPAVVNISITAAGQSPLMETAITNSIATGVVYTVSSGNNAWNACEYSPGRTPNAITVGASAQGDERPNYSNYGPCVDLHAPGYEIVSAGIASDTAIRQMNGTSMAAPLVAGVAAVYRASNPSASPAAVTSALLNASTNGTLSNVDGTTANKLLYSWLSGAPSPTPTPTATPTPTPTATPTPTPTPAPNGRVTIKKRVQSPSGGGPSSTTPFPYQATNIPTSSFSLVSNQEFTDPSVSPSGQVVAVTEASVQGFRLVSVECVEQAGSTPNIPNTTVDLTNRRADIRVESGESVTCTFTSEELAPTAGEAVISGRVIDSRGHGVRGIRLSVFNANTGMIMWATTNNMGYYAFDQLDVSNFYVVTAFGTKKFAIPNNERSFTLNDDMLNVDFFAVNQ